MKDARTCGSTAANLMGSIGALRKQIRAIKEMQLTLSTQKQLAQSTVLLKRMGKDLDVDEIDGTIIDFEDQTTDISEVTTLFNNIRDSGPDEAELLKELEGLEEEDEPREEIESVPEFVFPIPSTSLPVGNQKKDGSLFEAEFGEFA